MVWKDLFNFVSKSSILAGNGQNGPNVQLSKRTQIMEFLKVQGLPIYLSIYLSIFLYMHIMHKKPYITQLFQVFCPSPSEAPGGCQDLGPHGAPELRGARGAPDGGRAAVPEPGGVPWTLVGQFTREKTRENLGKFGFSPWFSPWGFRVI